MIASEIVYTYAAATRALADGGPYRGLVMAAVMIATGLKNVAEIEKTKVGFDDPISDIIATKLGRKSAEDFVKLFGGGFSERLQSAIGPPSTTHNTTINRSLNVTANGIIGSKTEMQRWLSRTLTDANRSERRTSI